MVLEVGLGGSLDDMDATGVDSDCEQHGLGAVVALRVGEVGVADDRLLDGGLLADPAEVISK